MQNFASLAARRVARINPDMTDNSFYVRDLGPLQGPVLIFGGPYSNLLATQAMREAAASLNIPGENVICTGDVVAYAGGASKDNRRHHGLGHHNGDGQLRGKFWRRSR